MIASKRPEELTIKSFFSNYSYVGLLFGIVISIGKNLEIPKFNSFIFGLVLILTYVILYKEGCKFKGRGKTTCMIFGLFGGAVAISPLIHGVFDISILIDYLRVAVYPFLGFICFYSLRRKAIPVLLAIFVGDGLCNLIINGYIFSTATVSESEWNTRTVISPFTGEAIRATGASASVIGLSLIGFFIFQTRIIRLQLMLFALCFSGMLFSIYVGSRGLIVTVVPFLSLYLLANTIKSRRGSLILVAIALTAAIFVGIVSMFENVRYILSERILERFSQERLMDSTFSNRTVIWEYGIEQGLAHSMGKGHVGVDEITGISLHNTFLEIWISYGIMALIFFIVLHIHFLLLCYLSARRKLKYGGLNVGAEMVILSCLGYYSIEAHLYLNFGLFTFLCCLVGCYTQAIDFPCYGRSRLLHQQTRKTR